MENDLLIRLESTKTETTTHIAQSSDKDSPPATFDWDETLTLAADEFFSVENQEEISS